MGSPGADSGVDLPRFVGREAVLSGSGEPFEVVTERRRAELAAAAPEPAGRFSRAEVQAGAVPVALEAASGAAIPACDGAAVRKAAA